MNILEIENLLGRLQKTQISLIEILKQDDDFCALTELQYRENAAVPFVVKRGAKLRTRLDRKYGGRPTSGTMFALDNALAEIEQTLDAVANAPVMPSLETQIAAPADEKQEEPQDQIADAVSVEPSKAPEGKMSIAEQAADRAVALAKLRDLKFARSEADIIAVGAPGIEDVQRVNFGESPAEEADLEIDVREPRPSLDEQASVANEDIVVADMHYFPTSSALARAGRGIAFAVVALITIVTIGSAHPEPAKASLEMLNTLYSAALTCCNIEVSAANLR